MTKPRDPCVDARESGGVNAGVARGELQSSKVRDCGPKLQGVPCGLKE